MKNLLASAGATIGIVVGIVVALVAVMIILTVFVRFKKCPSKQSGKYFRENQFSK